MFADSQLCRTPRFSRRHPDRLLHREGPFGPLHHVPRSGRLQVRKGLVQVRRSPRDHRGHRIHLHLRQIGESSTVTFETKLKVEDKTLSCRHYGWKQLQNIYGDFPK